MDPVSQSLFGLADRISQYGSSRRADEMALQNLGLQKAQLNLQQGALEGQRAADIEKSKREQWLSENVTIGQAIDTHPKWTTEQKQAIKDLIPEKNRESLLNYPTTRSKLNSAIDKIRSEKQGYSEAELTERALRGDRMAQSILDRMTERKKGTAEAGKTEIKNFMGTIPPGYSVDYDDKGRPVSMKAIPGGPAAGEITPKEKKESAQVRVSDILSEMKNLYEDLNEQGAIVSTKRKSVDNIASRIGASNIGQAASGAVGSEAQSTRNKINQMRPLLINHIRQASEMGARGLDSEKELEFYLQAATDPKLDIQSNLNALKVLDKAYGIGIFNGKNSGNGKSSEKRPRFKIIKVE